MPETEETSFLFQKAFRGRVGGGGSKDSPGEKSHMGGKSMWAAAPSPWG